MRAPALLLVALTVSLLRTAAAQGAWRVGRATFYGTDAWSIHKGSCQYNYIWPDEPLGWDVAAITDVSYAYIGSCGRCYEVRCNPSTFTDGYGERLDRNSVCYNPKASVVVRITDTCPCIYPANAYSNKRWCCGDMDHLDMSVWAFEKLADKKWGVIGMQFRMVPCDYKPEVVAPALAKPTPGQAPPPGAKKVNRGYNWQLTADRLVTAQSLQWASVPHDIYVNSLKTGWRLSASSPSTFNTTTPLGIRGGENSVCATLGAEGHLDLTSEAGSPFLGATLLEIWAYKQAPFGMVPAVNLLLVSNQGATNCRSLALKDLAPVSLGSAAARVPSGQDWVRFVIDIGANFADACSANPNTTFAGCSGAPVENITGLRFSNALGNEQVLCLDGMRLLSNVAAAQEH